MADDEDAERSSKSNAITDLQRARTSSKRSYRLVVIMLSLLTGLVVLIAVMPMFIVKYIDPNGIPDAATADHLEKIASALVDYSKWTIAVLLGAFGAWIGAGAAYFFGKENLVESSTSTEEALKLQQKLFQRAPTFELIKDMTLTAMNPNFVFETDADVKGIVEKLESTFRGYWFVPMVKKDTGVLVDIIHAQTLWGEKRDNIKLEDKIAEIEKGSDASLKKLHGASFFTSISLNDKISDVYAKMDHDDAEVAIVVDEKGKPSHCLTKTELRTFLRITD